LIEIKFVNFFELIKMRLLMMVMNYAIYFVFFLKLCKIMVYIKLSILLVFPNFIS